MQSLKKKKKLKMKGFFPPPFQSTSWTWEITSFPMSRKLNGQYQEHWYNEYVGSLPEGLCYTGRLCWGHQAATGFWLQDRKQRPAIRHPASCITCQNYRRRRLLEPFECKLSRRKPVSTYRFCVFFLLQIAQGQQKVREKITPLE